MSSPVPDDPPLTSADAARALCDFFLANADRGDNTANDELVAELVQRIRALQDSAEQRSQPTNHRATHLPATTGGAGGDVGG